MQKKTNIFAVILGFFCQCGVAQSTVNSDITTIKTYSHQHVKEALSFLNELVNINSGTSNTEGVKKVGQLLQAQLSQLGFDTYWVAEPTVMRRSPTLVANHPGKQGKALLLIGHLDTVFEPSSMPNNYVQQGNIAKGPGVADDKGGDVVMLYALKALQAMHGLDDRNITVVLTGDEEDSGKPANISRKPLLDAAKHSDIALEFESAIDLHSATIARRGITDWTILSFGHPGHSSDIFAANIGDGAILEVARILQEMRLALEPQPDITFSPGILLAGATVKFDANTTQGSAAGKTNMIAAQALVKGEFRYLTAEQKNLVEKTMQQIVAQHLPVTTAEVSFQDGIPAMPATKGNLLLLQQYSQVSELLGYGAITAVDPDLRGASDISYVANQVPQNLAGLGPVGVYLHSPKEELFIDSLPIAIERAALLMYQLTR